MEKTDILSLSKEELEEKILAMGEKKNSEPDRYTIGYILIK